MAPAGFDGIETYVPTDAGERRRMRQAIEATGLLCIAYQDEASGDIDAWCSEYRTRLRFAADLAPLFINSHTGHDHWSAEAVDRVLAEAFAAEDELGVTILRETHRSRIPYSAGVTASYLDRHPRLRLTADLSHWACVSESLLEDQEHHLAPALARSDHVHARVGWAQGAQVPDVRHPRWAEELRTHVGWWRRIKDHRMATGAGAFTITTEFGPPPYAPVDIETGEPVNDFRELDPWMRN